MGLKVWFLLGVSTLGGFTVMAWPHDSPAQFAFTDSAHDGMPDFLRLDDTADRMAFRRWFTFLAEAQFYRTPNALPAEISDCAGLIRYAYRETLKRHDGAWTAGLGLRFVPSIQPVAKYRYPDTPAKAGLFRTRSGEFHARDLSDGTFAQFADAKTLRMANTYFVGKDLRQARPGDLLFFRQVEQRLPFHTMIYLGRSQIEPGPTDYLLYHTGPDGEIRRPSVAELLAHPQPQWRPVAGNSNFLGVYRWNILGHGEL